MLSIRKESYIVYNTIYIILSNKKVYKIRPEEKFKNSIMKFKKWYRIVMIKH
jgi:hypothetical protein